MSSKAPKCRSVAVFCFCGLFVTLTLGFLLRELSMMQTSETPTSATDSPSPSSNLKDETEAGVKLGKIPSVKTKNADKTTSTSSTTGKSHQPISSPAAADPNIVIPLPVLRPTPPPRYRPAPTPQPPPPPAAPRSIHIYTPADKARDEARREQETLEQAGRNMREPSEALKCRTGKFLEESPSLIRKYGTVEQGGWCELLTEPVPEVSGMNRRDFHFRSSAYYEPLEYIEIKEKEQAERRKLGPNATLSPPSPSSTQRLPDRVPKGSTYFDYRSSSDGRDWNYYLPPIHHKIRCNTSRLKQEEADGGRKLIKSKALVVFVVSSAQAPMQHHVETNNLLFFLKNGLIPAKTPTALFDEVDFVFAKIQLAGEKTDSRFVDCGDFEEAKLIKERLIRLNKTTSSSSSTSSSSTTNDNNNSKNNNNNHADGYPSNIRFLLVPRVNCDICAHAKILDHLGIFNWKNESKRLDENGKHHHGSKIQDMNYIFGDAKYDDTQKVNMSNSYSQIIMLNSGARGPFYTNDEDLVHAGAKSTHEGDDNSNDEHQQNRHHSHHPKTTWVDYAAMGGRQKIPNPRLGFFHHPLARKNEVKKEKISKPTNSPNDFEEDFDECPIHVSSAVSISWEQKMHTQTYFVAAPIELMRTRLYSLFANTCSGDKVYCIVRGEVESARVVLDYSTITAVYSLGRQFHARDMGDDSNRRRDKYFVPARNPCYTWNDPAKSLFIKNAGHLVSDNKHFLKSMGGALDHLTRGMTMKKAGPMNAGFDYTDMLAMRELFGEKKCDWSF